MIENCRYCGGRNGMHKTTCVVVNKENRAQYELAFNSVVDRKKGELEEKKYYIPSTHPAFLQGWCNGLRALARARNQSRK